MSSFERDWADTQRSRLQDELREEHRKVTLAQKWAGIWLMLTACAAFWAWFWWSLGA